MILATYQPLDRIYENSKYKELKEYLPTRNNVLELVR